MLRPSTKSASEKPGTVTDSTTLLLYTVFRLKKLVVGFTVAAFTTSTSNVYLVSRFSSLCRGVENIQFCSSREKFHAVVLKGLRNISGAL